jgi:hypothetical protein
MRTCGPNRTSTDGAFIFESLGAGARRGVRRVFQLLVEKPDGKIAREFLDYRRYFREDIGVGATQKLAKTRSQMLLASSGSEGGCAN